MPLYDFKCEKCGNEFECQLKVAERDNPQKCPECGSQETKRAFGSFITPSFRGVHFKSQVEGGKPKRTLYPPTKPKYVKDK